MPKLAAYPTTWRQAVNECQLCEQSVALLPQFLLRVRDDYHAVVTAHSSACSCAASTSSNLLYVLTARVHMSSATSGV